jgi:beta-lactamase class A
VLALWPARGLSLPDASLQGIDAGPYLRALEPQLKRFANQTPGLVAISVLDLHGGAEIDINGDWNLPAASVIKVPVMVEVMRQVTLHRFTLDRPLTLLPGDRDCGYGHLCYVRAGTRFSVSNLVRIMIENSDNTATNMLIRLVGRYNINRTMAGLGLTQTYLGDYIRSDGDIRSLRTSANDMKQLFLMISARRLINAQASDVMLAILNGQRHNKFLPKALPQGVEIAHKTGTLHDTLNDVGIVFEGEAPYVIAVMTTDLRTLDSGRRFIRHVSRLAYDALGKFAAWREGNGFMPAAAFERGAATDAAAPLPDQQMWTPQQPTPAAPAPPNPSPLPGE